MDGLDEVLSDGPMTVVETPQSFTAATRTPWEVWGAASTALTVIRSATTGGGGAIVTNDESLRGELEHLTTTAKVSHPWAFP